MVAKESTPNSADYSYEEEEEEETLSLCDLPIYSKSDSWDEYDDDFSGSSKKYQSSASNDDDEEEEDFFEFFSEDFTAATFPINKEIIFCGKLITLAGQDQQKPTQDQNPKSCEKSLPEKPRRRRRKQSIFRYLLKSPSRSNDSKALASYDSEVRVSKMSSTMGSPAVKSRWLLFMFGMMRVPTEMKLRDMRMRQSRRRRSHSATMFPSFEEGKEETTADKVSYKRRGKGFWGMLRALGCRSRHPEVVAKAAYGCSPIPRE